MSGKFVLLLLEVCFRQDNFPVVPKISRPKVPNTDVAYVHELKYLSLIKIKSCDYVNQHDFFPLTWMK